MTERSERMSEEAPGNRNTDGGTYASGLLIEAGLVDTKTGELCYKKDRILQALKELKYDLET
ncbi:hypothetical protein AB9C19_23070, partial [Escherichia coli]